MSVQRNEMPLQVAAPDCYQKMNEVFQQYHLHPFDVRATLKQQEKRTCVAITLAGTSNCAGTFSFANGNFVVEEFEQFLHETAKKCREQLIADYYKSMKP